MVTLQLLFLPVGAPSPLPFLGQDLVLLYFCPRGALEQQHKEPLVSMRPQGCSEIILGACDVLGLQISDTITSSTRVSQIFVSPTLVYTLWAMSLSEDELSVYNDGFHVGLLSSTLKWVGNQRILMRNSK